MAGGQNIGGISFSVGANTEALKKVEAQIGRFSKAVDATTAKQTKNYRAVKDALVKQELQMRKALDTTMKYQASVKTLGLKEEKAKKLIDASDAALKTHTKTLSSVKLKTTAYKRSVDDFTRSIRGAASGVRKLNTEARKNKGLKKLTDVMRNMESASVLAVGPLSGIGARIRSLGAIAGRSSLLIVAAIGATVGVFVALVAATKAAIGASREYEASMARFKSATGSMAGARAEMQFVINTATKMGLRIDTSAKGFSRLTAAAAGTRLAGEGVRKVFLAVSQAAAALRLEKGEVEGTFRAIEQMMSKGTVQAEELRGQLGERLPGAFALAAQAMKVTTMELGRLLKAGEVTAAEFLPKLAEAMTERFGKDAAENIRSVTGATNLFTNSMFLLANQFSETTGVSTIWSNILVGLSLKADLLRIKMKGLARQWEDWDAARNNTQFDLGRKRLEEFREDEAYRILTAPSFDAEFTKAYQKAKGDIDKLITSIKLSNMAMHLMNKTNKDGITIYEELSNELVTVKMGQRGLETLTMKLNHALHTNLRPSVKNLAWLMTRFAQRTREADEAYQKMIRRPKVISGIEDQINTMMERIKALTSGVDMDDFQRVTIPLAAIKKLLKRVGIEGAAAVPHLERFRQTLLKLLEAEDEAIQREKDLKEVQKERGKVMKDLAKNLIFVGRMQTKLNKVLDDAQHKLEQLLLRNAALAKGPRSFEYFIKVTAPLAAYIKKMVDAGAAQEELTRKTDAYRAALEQKMHLEKIATIAKSMANSVGNALDAIIMRTDSLSDALKNLARELFNLFVRASFIDPLIKSLSGAFGNILQTFSAAAGSVAVGGGGGGGALKPGKAKGGYVAPFSSQKVGEEGVEILRMGSQGGTIIPNDALGGTNIINVTINAPGADEGTIARLKEIVRTELAPQIVMAATENTLTRIRRPRFA